MIKHWKVLILIVMVFGSLFAVGLKIYPYGRNGVQVIYVSPESPATGQIKQGDFITHLDDQQIQDMQDWKIKTLNLEGNRILRVNGRDVFLEFNKTVGIDVLDIDRTNLNLGLDLKGGTRIILEPAEDENVTSDVIGQVISTLETRANMFGLQEMKFSAVGSDQGGYFIQIEAAGVGKNIVDDLLSRQGDFEAKITRVVTLVNDTGIFKLGDNEHDLVLDGENLIVNSEEIEPDEFFTLDGIEFQYVNITDTGVFLLGKVYESKDIELVYTDPQRSGTQQLGPETFSFFFTVLVSQEGAERFAQITKNVPSYVDLQSGQEYLDSRIILFLDGSIVSDLRISSELQNQVYTTPTVTGTRTTLEDAIQERLTLQTVLRSGALPIKLETTSVQVISPTLGSDFFESAAIAMLIAGVVVLVVVYVRYRSFKASIPLVFIALSEVVIILGLSAANDMTIWGAVLLVNATIMGIAWWKKETIDIYVMIGAILVPLIGMSSWTLDLPAIGGIIAAIGTGVDHQIIIADETISGKKKQKQYDTKERIKRAFFIILGAAMTTIAAMIPLAFLGIGLVRGFAITTIVGVLVGILITRPAYARIVEIMKAKE